MVDQCTMAELLRAPTEGYAEAIVIPPILAEQFELKHGLINFMTTDQFFGLEKDNSHDHIRWFNKMTSTIKYKDVPNFAIKLMLFTFSLAGVARRWLEKEPPRSIHTWEDPPLRTTNLRNEISNFQQRFDESFHEAWDRYKDLFRACPHHGFIELHQLDTFYNALNPADQDSLNAAAGGNLLERRTQDMLTIIENKSKVCNSRNKAVVSQVKSCDANSNSSSEIAKLTHAVNQQTSVVTTAMTAILKQFQATPPPASVKSVEEICVTCGGAHPYYQCLAAGGNTFPELRDNIQGYKMLKALLSKKEKLQELANTPLNENCSAVILKKLPEKLGDPRKFLILCGFSELKCKSLADLGASINLMPLSVWKRLGLPELIFTRMTLELGNRAICPPAEIARDVFIPIGKFTFPANFVIIDYESDPRVPLILGRLFLRTARALIDVHGEEMILHDDFLEDLFSNQPSGNLAFSSHPELTLPEVKYDIFDSEGDNFLPKKFLDLDSTKDLHPPLHVNPLSGSTTYSSSPNPLLEELADELALITFPLKYIDQSNLANPADNFVDYMSEMFTDEHAPNYSSPSIFDEYDDDLFKVEFDTENVYDDPFDSKGEKIKESKLLIDELNLPYDFLPSKYDLFTSEDFSSVDAKPPTNNEDKVFNPGILIQEKPFKIVTRVVQDKKMATSNASLVLEDFDPRFYEPLFTKEVPSIPENLKTIPKDFVLQVFISSASPGNHVS
nr:reverse transcriptase domain-containing protein [Tanacetum cinerariifolium]